MSVVRRGSVKEVYEGEHEDELVFLFTDRISVFDKPIPSEVPHKGETLCRTAVHWFEQAERMGISTHFIEQPSPNTMRVRRVNVISDYSQLNPSTRNYLIPLEFISRYYVAGSLYDRLKSGKVSPEDVGFSSGHRVEYGEPLPEPFCEVSTKLERVDRLLSTQEALRISGLTPDELEHIWEMIHRIDEHINRSVARRGLVHVDGKKEFAFDENRELMLVDVFGTADEDRFWDGAAYDEGRFVEKSKELVRQYYRSIGYVDALYEARRKGEPEPPIPPMPEELITRASQTYIELFEQITGERFS
ncbi:phosphoribosylaminoimidazolesuccinocarboxamide synthase [Methermicoccus shengliensis]|uniref:phosphoribosylaminoimidazolesuccinocarboxamide synthase n=1 Tax=Methermicoccus shengliensis TaxID=660064 RepID=UPI0005B2C4B8|nr:phosphoribosylaminoimidazolesuccinocarboxamide synthase [Methermicoccus shengliensis]KUK04186.1 MAG: Phosphoribosylaminoimidazole-succinocarboxamide synthase, putative [Euryarchaeota archaeon 55_53]KUK29889.1 MAG: Phosphoribosylaminoimidazole-succinocarboxamide synthase, putative [Methanosarcinales archeaon 56_1174]MDI3488375.1 phosphoribosylaminoimidazole-succinocarboxamide synthase [Methanosarcinales archaeon]MDN5295850.1 phosphoribosylaminoimidazole-succinocarboxamide synthase [Methanosar